MKGIDRPEGADEWWRPSLEDHLRFAEIEIAFNARHKRAIAADLWRHGDDRYTPQQLQQLMVLRRHLQRWPR
jgi:hypothetical protein